MALIVKPGGIKKLRVGHFKFARFIIHARYEVNAAFFGMECEGICRIIG